jgi:hypothetical protein
MSEWPGSNARPLFFDSGATESPIWHNRCLSCFKHIPVLETHFAQTGQSSARQVQGQFLLRSGEIDRSGSWTNEQT